MRALLLLSLAPLAMILSGCLARVAADVVTAPVRVGSKAVDLATTSQSEADEARGREIRKREERLGKLDRQYREASEDCVDGDQDACKEARAIRAEMDALMASVPVEPDN